MISLTFFFGTGPQSRVYSVCSRIVTSWTENARVDHRAPMRGPSLKLLMLSTCDQRGTSCIAYRYKFTSGRRFLSLHRTLGCGLRSNERRTAFGNPVSELGVSLHPVLLLILERPPVLPPALRECEVTTIVGGKRWLFVWSSGKSTSMLLMCYN